MCISNSTTDSNDWYIPSFDYQFYIKRLFLYRVSHDDFLSAGALRGHAMEGLMAGAEEGYGARTTGRRKIGKYLEDWNKVLIFAAEL